MLDMTKRAYPGPDIERAIAEWRKRGMHLHGGIVEIGCMRSPLTHSIVDGSTCEMCSDGHSTAHFARAGARWFRSVDISEAHCRIAGSLIDPQQWQMVVQYDGIKYLRTFGDAISFLFLDAWDADMPDTAEQHLEAFKAAWHCLCKECIVLIDDCDVVFDHERKCFEASNGRKGKGELVIPYAESAGFKVLWDGRTVCLVRG